MDCSSANPAVAMLRSKSDLRHPLRQVDNDEEYDHKQHCFWDQEVWDAFQIWVYQTNGHKFKEQKKVASKSNLNHLVEPVDSRRKKKVKTEKK